MRIGRKVRHVGIENINFFKTNFFKKFNFKNKLYFICLFKVQLKDANCDLMTKNKT